MAGLASRAEYAQDPLSPYQSSQPRTDKKSTRKFEKPTPKTDLTFIDKVTKGHPESVFWDKMDKNQLSAAMGVAAKDKTRKAVQAFKEGRRLRAKEEFSHFCEETSFTALVRIHNASSWARRIGWIVVFLAMLCWLTVQCFWLLDKYFSWPMEVKMDILAAKELEFPSVTVCNLNPMKNAELWMDEFTPLRHFTDLIEEDDVLYDFYYDNYEWLYSTPSYNNHWWTTNSYGYTTGTPGTGPPLATAASSVTPPQTPPPSSGQSSQSRRKRSAEREKGQTTPKNLAVMDASNDKSASSSRDNSPPPLHAESKKTFGSGSSGIDELIYKDNPDDQGDNTLAFGSDDDSVVNEEDWTALEKQIFGDDAAERVRRQASSPKNPLDYLRNNSFNKWDALDNSNINVSYYETRGAEYKAAMAYATLTAQLPANVTKKSGHSLNDFLLTCRFNGYQCSPSNFTYFHSHKYGNCYTFNSHESPTQLETKFSGPEFGLTLEMFIQQEEYVPALAAEAGVRVLIHPKGTVPFPEDDGLSIPPAHSTSVSIRRVEIVRLVPPHGTCDENGSSMDLYAATRNTTYTKLSCLKSCYQTIVNKYCNCSVPMNIVSEGDTICNMTDDNVDCCTSNLPSMVPAEYDNCNKLCPQPCFEVDYDMLVSSAAWPSDAYESHLQTKLRQSSYLLMDGAEEEDFVKLNVYYKDLMYQKIEQQKAYESQNLISDIGGQLGLWLGLSAITLGELCGLILSLFRSFTSAGVSPSKGDNSSKTPVKPFSQPPELDPSVDDIMLTDVKSRGYV